MTQNNKGLFIDKPKGASNKKGVDINLDSKTINIIKEFDLNQSSSDYG